MTLIAMQNEVSADGRLKNGQFGPGNDFGPGNPNGRRVAQLRQALFLAIGPDDIREIALALIAQAKAGDLGSARIVLHYVLGRPGSWNPADLVEEAPAEIAVEPVAATPAPQPAAPAVALTPLPARPTSKAAEILAARNELRPDLSVERMMGLTPPSPNGVNGGQASATIAIVNSPSATAAKAVTAKK
jgi:hypothetical protein